MSEGPTRLSEMLRKSLVAFHGFWAIPTLLFFRVLRPWRTVRLGLIGPERIGHFVMDTSLYLASRSLPSDNKVIDLLYMPRHSSNEQWSRMVRRTLKTHWWVQYLLAYDRRLPGQCPKAYPVVPGSRDVNALLQQSSRRFEFTRAEDEDVKAWLRRRGWRDGERFVCLLVRDSAYLSRHPLHAHQNSARWSYHDYRDSDIRRYAEAIQALLDRGYWVMRMGKIMHEPVPITHERLIDYPFLVDQSDLIDIWMSVNCAFFVSTGTGLDMLPIIYGKPVLFVNLLPFGKLLSFADSISLPKNCYWKETGEMLTFQDHLSHAHYTSEAYQRAGISVDELSTSELYDAFVEMADRVECNEHEDAQDAALQQQFWAMLRRWREFPIFHGHIHARATVGHAWLRSHADVFLRDTSSSDVV